MPWQKKRTDIDLPYCPEHACWCAMWSRCLDNRGKAWRNYGGRGITVCEQWRDFFAFFKDIGKRPSPEHSLDRIDVNGNYEPGNVRWATFEEQSNNKRRNRRITIDGQTKTLIQWCRQYGVNREVVKHRFAEYGDWKTAFETAGVNRTDETKIRVMIDGVTKPVADWARERGIPCSVVKQRVARDGMTWEQALSVRRVGYHERAFNKRKITINGKTQGLREWCRELGISDSTVWKRLKSGMTEQEALTAPVDKTRSHDRYRKNAIASQNPSV